MVSQDNTYNTMLTEFYNNLNYLQNNSINNCDHIFEIIKGYLDGGSRDIECIKCKMQKHIKFVPCVQYKSKSLTKKQCEHNFIFIRKYINNYKDFDCTKCGYTKYSL